MSTALKRCPKKIHYNSMVEALKDNMEIRSFSHNSNKRTCNMITYKLLWHVLLLEIGYKITNSSWLLSSYCATTDVKVIATSLVPLLTLKSKE